MHLPLKAVHATLQARRCLSRFFCYHLFMPAKRAHVYDLSDVQRCQLSASQSLRFWRLSR